MTLTDALVNYMMIVLTLLSFNTALLVAATFLLTGRWIRAAGNRT